MPYVRTVTPRLDELDDLSSLLLRQSYVISRRQALRYLTPAALQHRLETGRWQAVHRSVYLAHTGPVTGDHLRWVAGLATGGVLGGLSALSVLGLRGYGSSQAHVLLPARRRDFDPPPGVVVHRTSRLPAADLHRMGSPACTMPARSLIDAAQWARTDEEARAIVVAGFQQRLVGGTDVADVLNRMPRARRRAIIGDIAADASTGVQSVSEAQFGRLCRRNGLPIPTRQVRRLDANGRPRYLDAYFEQWRVHVEIDGGQHIEIRAWWADMKRQNDLWIPGDRLLRFPNWAVRHRPAEVAAQVRAALLAAGWRPGGSAPPP